MRSTLVISFALHLLVFFLLTQKYLKPTEPPQPISLVYPSPENKPSQASGKRGAIRVGRGKKMRPLSDFLPQLAMKQTDQKQDDDTDIGIPAWSNPRAYNGVDPIGNDNLSRDQIHFLMALWRMIDQSIWDTPFLSEYNHTGQVFLRFEINDEGKFVSRSMTASAVDRVLKVIATRAVRKAMMTETDDLHFPLKHTVINARFKWASYAECDANNPLRANYLSFCHYAENKFKSFSAAERTGTVAGAIWNHGPWAAEEIREYNRQQRRRDGQFDPFENLRRDPDWNL